MNRFNLISLAAAVATVVLATAPAHAALGSGEGKAGYPHELAPFSSTIDRAEVRADAVRAVAAGLVASGEFGLKLAPSQSTANRVQVQAEAAEAVRLGLVASGEQSLVYTAEQNAAVKSAGQRASGIVVAGRR